METRFNDIIHRIFYMLKLNTMVLIGIFCGGCVFSSFISAINEHYRAKGDSSLISFKQWWRNFVIEIKQTALLSWGYNAVFVFFLWALWFTSQFQGFIFFVAWLIQFAFFCTFIMAFLGETHLRQYYEGDARQIVKLSWIQVFIAPKANLLTLLLLIIYVIIIYQMPAIVAFWGIGTWISFTAPIYTKEWRRLDII